MALNLKTLGTRSISAAVFVILLIGCVWWNYYSFSFFFFAVSMLALHEFYTISEKLNVKALKIPGYIAAVLCYSISWRYTGDISGTGYRHLLIFLTLCSFFALFGIGLFCRKENMIRDSVFSVTGVLYAVLPFTLLHEAAFFANEFDPRIVLGIIFLIWCNDTFAYLGGSLFGKNKMIERISPGKTWEGTIIGILITFGLSFCFNHYIYYLGKITWPIMGVVVPVLATTGDLVESKLKREAGVKDSGKIMPGHGGALDRFDSLIFVSPFAVLILECIKF